jgi:hypothetical protein
MSIPTVAEIVAEIKDILGDPTGKVITTTVAENGYKRAYRRLRQAMLNRQISYVRKQVTYTLAAETASLTPATAGITDFGELVRMEEREDGSDDQYSEVRAVESLPHAVDPGPSLGVYEWREDTFWFPEASANCGSRISTTPRLPQAAA